MQKVIFQHQAVRSKDDGGPTFLGKNGYDYCQGVEVLKKGDLLRISPLGMRGVARGYIDIPENEAHIVSEALNPTPVGVQKVLDISTAHLTQETVQRYTNEGGEYLLANYEYGLLFWVPDQDWLEETLLDETSRLDIPFDLAILLMYAASLGCYMLRVDCDGILVETDLPLCQ